MEIKIFDRWQTTGIKVEDPGLKKYINLAPVLVPKTGGRNNVIRFYRNKYNIVERLINKMMGTGHKGKHEHFISSGHFGGNAQLATKIVEKAFEIIEKRTKKNPIEVFVKAVENASPREEIVTIEYGGARYPKAVECAPQRRVDIALRNICRGAYQKAFNKKKNIKEALADEIIAAYQLSMASMAISKKIELERQADSSR